MKGYVSECVHSKYETISLWLLNVRSASHNPYIAGIDFSQQNLYRRQILMTKVDHGTVRVQIFLIVIDP